MILDSVKAHYVNSLGEPDRRANFSIAGQPVDIFKWEANKNPEGVALYASIGAAARPGPSDPTHRSEFFAGFLPEQDAFAKVLAIVALDGVTNGSTLGHGQTITYPEDLWTGTQMRSVIILRQKESVLPLLEVPDLHVEFLQVVPLYNSELSTWRQFGTEALLEVWDAQQVEFWNPNRTAAA